MHHVGVAPSYNLLFSVFLSIVNLFIFEVSSYSVMQPKMWFFSAFGTGFLKSLDPLTSFRYGFVLVTRSGFPPPLFIFPPSSLPFPFSFFPLLFCVRDWTLCLVNPWKFLDPWTTLIALEFLREGVCKPRFFFLGPQENSRQMCVPMLSSTFVKLGSITSIWSLLCVWFILW